MSKILEYFDNVKLNDKVYGLIFGEGEVIYSLGDAGLQGFYNFEVEFENGQRVFYTSEGIPNWSQPGEGYQTLFYKKDILMDELDFEPLDKILKPKKIMKLREKGLLQARCPSGAWINAQDCPGNIIEQYLTDGRFHLFRKEP